MSDGTIPDLEWIEAHARAIQSGGLMMLQPAAVLAWVAETRALKTRAEEAERRAAIYKDALATETRDPWDPTLREGSAE